MATHSAARWTALALVGLAFAGLTGCERRAASSREAIEHAKTLKTPEQQANYLIAQANTFLNAKRYDEATATIQHLLAHVDKDSQAAMDLLTQTKAQASLRVKQAGEDLKTSLGVGN